MENLHSHHDFCLGAMVDGGGGVGRWRGDGDPDTAESQHAGCQELGFSESVEQISSQENHSGSLLGQGCPVSQEPLERK